MHCPTLESMFALSEDDNKAALQTGHSMAMEEHIYGVSSGYLGQCKGTSRVMLSKF